MLHTEVGKKIDLGNPSIILQRLSDLTVFARRSLENEWCYLLGLPTIYPGSLPERGSCSAPNGDCGGCVEEVKIMLIAWIAHANPRFGRLFSSKPCPLKPQSSCELVRVKHFKASSFIRPAYHVPVHLALHSCCLVRFRPKENSFQFVGPTKSAWWYDEWCNVV